MDDVCGPATVDATVSKTWRPKRVMFTPDALQEAWGQAILRRSVAAGLPIIELSSNRITGIRGKTERETYARAKSTLAVVNAPVGQLKLQPIPPSADWQFHLAQGCPAHCQYCYLAGSLSGPPLIRVYANLPAILNNLKGYRGRSGSETTFEVSCYTDPLGLEHLTGSLGHCIDWFGRNGDPPDDATGRIVLRWVSKFDGVDDLLSLDHRGHTQCRFSLNADQASGHLEGGTSSMESRLVACRKLLDAGYPIGLVIAPIMPTPRWSEDYTRLLHKIAQYLPSGAPITFELITHRFTSGSKQTLLRWYPKTKLDLDEAQRTIKRNKFGGTKYVYPKEPMSQMRRFFEHSIPERFPDAKILYWT